jgi:hypothetical protein
MPSPKFRLEVSYNETTGDPVAAYLRIREAPVFKTEEISEGIAFADYGPDGFLVGIELLAPCPLAVLDRVAANEPESVRNFLRAGVRKEMVCA